MLALIDRQGVSYIPPITELKEEGGGGVYKKIKINVYVFVLHRAVV